MKTIPAAVPDTLFRNSLRVGMIDYHFFAGFDFRLPHPDGPTYTPDAAQRERPYCFRSEFRSIAGLERGERKVASGQ